MAGLVVAELQRDRAPDTVKMQAIKYAAMASRFTEDTLVEQHACFLSRNGTVVDQDSARQRLLEHASDLDPEQLRRPRIVLVADSFPPVVTATVVWLSEMGVYLVLQRVQTYRVFDDKTVVTVSQLFPVADVEEFTVSPVVGSQRVFEAVRQAEVPVMDTARARNELGWPPRRSSLDAFQELLEGLRAGAGMNTPPLSPTPAARCAPASSSPASAAGPDGPEPARPFHPSAGLPRPPRAGPPAGPGLFASTCSGR
jgi:hypothetical protein